MSVTDSTAREPFHPEGDETPVTETELIAACRRGDAAAFEVLIERTEAGLRGFLSRGNGYHNDIDDLIQETYLRAWKGISGFRGESGVSTWLTRIAVNISRNRQRDHKPAIPLDAGRLASRPAIDAVQEQRIQQAYRKAVGHLPEELWTVFRLHESDGLSYREIADHLSCPLGTVMSRLHRARGRLLAEMRDAIEEWMP